MRQPIAVAVTRKETEMAEETWPRRRTISEAPIRSTVPAAAENEEAKAEEAWRDRRVISEIPTSTKNVFLAETAAEQRGEQPAIDATSKAQPRLAEVVRKWRANTGVAPKRSVKGVVDRMAAVVAEAKEKRRKVRGSVDDENISASVAGSESPLGTSSARTGLVSGLLVGRRSSKISDQSPGETDAEAEMRMHVEATNEVWERVMLGKIKDEFDLKTVDLQIVTAVEGM